MILIAPWITVPPVGTSCSTVSECTRTAELNTALQHIANSEQHHRTAQLSADLIREHTVQI